MGSHDIRHTGTDITGLSDVGRGSAPPRGGWYGGMWTTTTVLAASIIALIAIAIAASYFRLFLALRGQRVVTCPETHAPVGVTIDAARAARSTLVDNPMLCITTCSRWPERADCFQECLSQIEAHPEDTLLRNILSRWYLDKDCAICARPIGTIEWHDAIPALRAPDGKYVNWEGVTAENVGALLEMSVPVCWNCYSAETFRTTYPDLVTDREDAPLRKRLIH